MISINILHLLWIVPVAGTIGFVAAAFFFAARLEAMEEDYYDDGT